MEFRAAPGRWSTSYPMPVVASVITTASGTLYVARFRSVVSIDAIAFTVSSAAATGVIRIVIYDDAAWPYPGARVFLSADLACATTGLKQVTIPGGLPPGTYWVGVHNPGPVNVAAARCKLRRPVAPWTANSYRSRSREFDRLRTKRSGRYDADDVARCRRH